MVKNARGTVHMISCPIMALAYFSLLRNKRLVVKEQSVKGLKRQVTQPECRQSAQAKLQHEWTANIFLTGFECQAIPKSCSSLSVFLI